MWNTPPRWKNWLPLAGLLAAFGAVCYSNLGAYEMLIWDEAEYACLGRSLARGQGYDAPGDAERLRPPLLPAAIAASLMVTGQETDWAAKIPMPLFAMLAIAIVYGIVLHEHGVWPAAAAGWSLAIAPEFATRAVMLLSETPFLAFYTLALVAFFPAFHRRRGWFHLAWIAFALAHSTRHTALLLGPTLLLIAAYEWRRGNLGPTLRTRAFWLSPLWAAAILGPWFYRQWLVSGDALVGIKRASGQIPAYDLAVMPWHFYLSTLPEALTWPVALLGCAGLAYAVWKGLPLGTYAAIGTFVLLAWHSQYSYKEARLVAGAWPLLAVGAGIAVHALERSAFAKRAVSIGLLGVATILSALAVRNAFAYRIALGEPSFLEAMAYLRRNSAPDAVLMGPNSAQIQWYADRAAIEIPRSEKDFSAAASGADWLILTNFERGQPEYAAAYGKGFSMADQVAGDAAVFRDERFQTAVIKRDLALNPH